MRATHGDPDEPTDTTRRQPPSGGAATPPSATDPPSQSQRSPGAGECGAAPGCGARWLAHRGSLSRSRPAAVSRL